MKFSSTLRPLLWGVFGGAIGWWAVLAFVFGWTSAGTANRHADTQASQAVVAALASVCADRFLSLPNAAEKKVALAKALSWERGEIFPKDWVTLPDSNSPDTALIEACSKIVLETKSGPSPSERDAVTTPPREG